MIGSHEASKRVVDPKQKPCGSTCRVPPTSEATVVVVVVEVVLKDNKTH